MICTRRQGKKKKFKKIKNQLKNTNICKMLNNEELKKRGIHNHNVPKMTQKKTKTKTNKPYFTIPRLNTCS